MSNEKPRNYAILNLPGFECRCDGEWLEARAGDGPWTRVAMPPQGGVEWPDCGCTDGTDPDEPSDRGFICPHDPRGVA